MKTVKQIADELGVNKQKVYRFIKRNCISEAHQKNGVMYYDEATETLIYSHFNKISPQSEAHHEVHQSTSNDAVIDAVIKMLQQELEVKNKQISELTAALENTTASLQAAQALHAGTMQQQLLPEASADVTEEPPAKRSGFFGWLERIK